MTTAAELVERIEWADIEPTNLPAHATLVVSRVDDPLPGVALWDTERWLDALRRELEQQVRLAGLAAKAGGAERAVVFPDEVAVVVARAEAVAALPTSDRWYHLVLAVGAPDSPAAVLGAQPELIPAAIVELMARHGETVVRRLVGPFEAEQLTALTETAFAVTIPRPQPALATESPPGNDMPAEPTTTWFEAPWPGRAQPAHSPEVTTLLRASAQLVGAPGSLHVAQNPSPTPATPRDPESTKPEAERTDPTSPATPAPPHSPAGRLDQTAAMRGTAQRAPVSAPTSATSTTAAPFRSDEDPGLGPIEISSPTALEVMDLSAPLPSMDPAAGSVPDATETRFAGFVYVVNLIRALELFDRVSTDPGWSLLAGLTRLAVRHSDPDGDDDLPDPLWSAFLELAGADDPIDVIEVRVGQAVIEVSDAWAGWVAPALLGTQALIGDVLCSALDRVSQAEEGVDEQRSLLHVGGLATIGRTHVDVSIPIDQIDLRIRGAGLDADPGWVPELARVITLEFAG